MTEVPFDRNVAIQFDDLIYRSDYRLSFSVTKKRTGKNRNSAKIQIYNPDPAAARAAIARKGRRFVQVRAGYGDAEPPILFAGYAVPDGAVLTRSGPDTILVVEAKGFGSGPSAKSEPKTIQISEKLTAQNLLAAGEAAFGVAMAVVDPAVNISTVGTRALSGVDVPFLAGSGWSFTGSFEDFVLAAASKLEADFSLQGGRAVFTSRRRTQGNTGPVFSSANGTIIEAPSARPKGMVRFKTLLTPLEAGYRFIVEDAHFGGVYRVESVVLAGDVGWDNQFYASIDGRMAPKPAKVGDEVLDPLAPFKALGRGIGVAATEANKYLSDPAARVRDYFEGD